MATRKITITVPEELVESIKERVDSRGVSGYIATSDTDDMNQLLAGHSVRVEKV